MATSVKVDNKADRRKKKKKEEKKKKRKVLQLERQ